jgi:hypothetical protein
MNADQYSLFLKALTLKATVQDITLATGMTRQTVAKTLKAMRRQAVAHIDAWEPDNQGRWTIARWALGEGQDASKPAAQTPADKQRAYRERAKLR